MKIISLWQPWASLMALNLKQNETRSWYVGYRGPLGIHAAKKVIPFEQLFDELTPEQRLFVLSVICNAYGNYDNLPTGAIIAAGNLTDIVAIEKVTPELTALERAFGDYSPGRFAWQMTDIVNLKEPIPAKGQQGLWDFDLEGALNHG